MPLTIEYEGGPLDGLPDWQRTPFEALRMNSLLGYGPAPDEDNPQLREAPQAVTIHTPTGPLVYRRTDRTTPAGAVIYALAPDV